jgi:hypothetical protein
LLSSGHLPNVPPVIARTWLWTCGDQVICAYPLIHCCCCVSLLLRRAMASSECRSAKLLQRLAVLTPLLLLFNWFVCLIK